MRLLLDTHLLLWAATAPERLSRTARKLIGDPANQLHFSVVSLWEIIIKSASGRSDLSIDAHALRLGLVASDYRELEIKGSHALAVAALPDRHKDPFDHMLIAQATAEGMTLLTSDKAVADYPGPVRKV